MWLVGLGWTIFRVWPNAIRGIPYVATLVWLSNCAASATIIARNKMAINNIEEYSNG